MTDAAQLMGVHPATLRAWADRGRIASQRTAGGHRRFNRAGLQGWVDAHRSNDVGVQTLVHSVLGRLRLAMEQIDAPWMARFDEDARRVQRELGRRLMLEIAHAVSAPGVTDSAHAAAQGLGREYAALAQARSLPLAEALRAFLFFRDTIADSLVQMSSALEPVAAPSWQVVHRQLCAFLNEVLLALVTAYEER
ncbi:MAG TPA: helix-turn-helix domain-containing protein [Anaerolineae bacterium]